MTTLAEREAMEHCRQLLQRIEEHLTALEQLAAELDRTLPERSRSRRYLQVVQDQLPRVKREIPEMLKLVS